MKIAIVCDVLGAENNGTTIAAMNLIRSLREKGHQVRVVCPDPERRGQRDFYVVPTYNFGPLNGYVAKNGVRLAKPDKTVLSQALSGVDVVHLLVPFGLSRAAAAIAEAKHIPITASFHCQAENFTNHIFMMNFGLANHLTYHFFYKLLYRRCNYIHYPTQFICDTFEKEVGPTPHCVISNGVNASFCPGAYTRPAAWEDRFAILFTGRYSKEKSHKILIDAAARSAYKDKIQLVFAGSGPQAENIRKRAKKRGLHPPVMEFYSRQALINVIRSADLYVHPAEIEIEAISCQEAISCGKVPVISNSSRSATRFFALSEKNLFACNDSADLARKIDYWIEHPEARSRCSEDYLGFAHQFDFQLCMDKMEQMLLNAARGTGHENSLLS